MAGRPRFGLLLGLFLCLTTRAWGTSFTVSPIQIVLTASTTSALLTVANQSDETLRLEVSAFAWDQDPDGQMQLTATEDVLFFPSLLTLGPGERRNVRVGAATAVAPSEKTYRIFVEELPPPEGGSTAPKKSGVRILTRMGIPVFIPPAKPAAKCRIEELAAHRGRLSFSVRNAGNVHLLAGEVRVRGIGARDEQLFERRTDGWYVLAGGARDYVLEIPSAECHKTRAVAVEVETEQGSVAERVELPPDGCPS